MTVQKAKKAAPLAVLTAVTWSPAVADMAPRRWDGVPAQIIPQALETGAPAFNMPTGTSTFMGSPGAGSTGGPGSGSGGTMVGSDPSYEQMMAQSYGQTALSTAQLLGVNPNATAGLGVLESGFQNVPTANGSSSATGPWQITSGTWNDAVSSHNLPYTAADRTAPTAQAVVANYILKDYASQVSAATGLPSTVQQTYGAWVFGPQAGSQLAKETDMSVPMSNYVSAAALANNNMTGWTVGQFYNRVSAKIGNVATQTVGS